MTLFLKDDPIIANDLKLLLKDDKAFAPYNINPDNILWPRFESGVKGLVRILIGQQISFKAVDALWLKLNQARGKTDILEFLKSQSEEALKSYGFSRQKQTYLHALIGAIDNGFNVDDLNDQSETNIIKAITSLKGFGVWSAQIYLLFSLRRRDVLPDNDLVIDKALQHIFNLENRPNQVQRARLSHLWSGRKTAATLILWHLQIYHFQ